MGRGTRLSRESGVYQNLTAGIVQNGTAEEGNALVDTPSLQAAVQKTFTPAYAQQTTEKTLDGFYDWAEGDTPNFTVDLSLSDKQPELTANLASELSQQLAALPMCANPADFNAQNPACVPQGLDINQTASQAAAQAIGGTEAQTNTPRDNPAVPIVASARSLPSTMDTMWLWVRLAPVVAVVSAILIFAIAASRLRALMGLSVRILIGTVLTLVFGLLLAYFGQAVSLDYISGEQQAVVRRILEPVLQIAIPDIGRQLAITSAGVALVVGTAWVALFFVRQRWYGPPMTMGIAEGSASVPAQRQMRAADEIKTTSQ